MVTKDEVQLMLDTIQAEVELLQESLEKSKASRTEFLAGVKLIETKCKELRAAVIMESRAAGAGLTVDGSRDLRFLRNREELLKEGRVDLRYSKQPAHA